MASHDLEASEDSQNNKKSYVDGRRMAASVGMVLLGSTLVLLASCSGDDDPGSKFDGGSSGLPNGDGGPNSSGFTSSSSGLPEASVETCVAKEAEAIKGKRPVDIIIAIDNSESMSEEIGEVEKQINQNFANIIEASNTDYRVVMLSRHGMHDAVTLPPDSLQKICVKSPLSGTDCALPLPAAPAETAKFIQHDIVINSLDSWCQILQTFNGPDSKGRHPQGWAPYLRPNAFKVFVVMTDDRINTSCNGFVFDDKNDDPVSGTNAANTFESALLSLSAQFGTATRRNYVWHSIVGLAPFDGSNKTLPHPPEAPIVTSMCTPSAVAPATGYQALSKLTGGLRYPTCGLDYTTIFQAVAKDVIDNASLACDYAMPANPAGGTIDPSTAVVRYTSGDIVTDFAQAANEAACAPGKFYIENNRIKLCPDACFKVQTDQKAQVKILFGCLPKEQK